MLSLGRHSTRNDDLSVKLQIKLFPEAPCVNLTATPLHEKKLAPPRARCCGATLCAIQTAQRNASVNAIRANDEPKRNGQDVHRAAREQDAVLATQVEAPAPEKKTPNTA